MNTDARPPFRSSSVMQVLGVAAVYFAAAKLGLTMAFVAEQVTAVWPPTGIALAAVLLLGTGIWPGIALGAFVANVTSHANVAAAGIATGNTLEALVGAWLLRQVGFAPSLTRLRDALALIVLAAGVSTVVSATIGVTSLCLAGVQPCGAFASLWSVWWFGDAMGDLVMAPLLLVWATHPRVAWVPRQLAEATMLIAVLLAVSAAAFARAGTTVATGYPFQHYTLFPVVIWAALRFGQRATVTATFIAAGIAIWSTVHGVGPFAMATVNESLVALQVFMAVVAVTALLLSAAITERKALERDLRRQTEVLADADRRKDEFLAMLAHELRNPLAPLRNALDLLRRGEPAVVARARELMHRQLEHLVRLVDDLLDVSRITSGKILVRREPLPLASIVATAVEISRPLLDANAHELHVTLPPEPVLLDADPTRLPQALANLLNNAAKYTPRGGHVWLTAEHGRDGLVLRVRDSGIGMTPEALGRAFDLFSQAGRTLDSAESGLGIGLTLVRRLVEQHGGTVSARSEGPGRGTEITVRLPVLQVARAGPARGTEDAETSAVAATTPIAPTSAIPITAEVAGGRTMTDAPPPPALRRVLIVDDNVDAAESVAMLLQTANHDVRVAHDGLAALSIAREFAPDVVLLDIGLPRMDGYAVARALRAEPSLNGVRLIALSGYGQDDDRRRSQEAGFDHHLVKPVEPAALETLIAAT